MNEETESVDRRQRDVAYAMVRGERTLEEILEAHEVTEEEFVGWVCGGQFPAYAASLARGFAETKAAYVWTELMALTREGSVPAMRLYLDFLYKKPAARGNERAGMLPNGAEFAGLRDSIFTGEGGIE